MAVTQLWLTGRDMNRLWTSTGVPIRGIYWNHFVAQFKCDSGYEIKMHQDASIHTYVMLPDDMALVEFKLKWL